MSRDQRRAAGRRSLESRRCCSQRSSATACTSAGKQNQRLTEKDAIVIADFENRTGDTVFDCTLKTALTVALTQSSFLNVLSDNQVAQTLKLMMRPAGTMLTPEIARELCLRANSKAYIAGDRQSGQRVRDRLKVVNCQSGESLGPEQVTAKTEEGYARVGTV